MLDLLTSNVKTLLSYFVDANQRLFWGYLLSAYLFGSYVFFTLAAKQVNRAGTSARIFQLFVFLFPKHIFLSRSAINDYLLFVVNKLIRLALFPLIIVTMVPVALFVSSLFEKAFGLITPLSLSPVMIMVIFTFLLFIFDDLTRFLLHYLLHKVPVLWEFHKVHHSATVLTPFTVYRSHPVENYLYACRMALTQGFVVGLCYYLFGATLKMIDILGANIFVFAFNILASNLRHSHIWLTWGDKLEGVLLSPAQHQIHHSDNVIHFDKNFGTALAIWDRISGCLVRASEVGKINVGIGKEGEKHKLIFNIYLQPFINVYHLCFKGKNKVE